MNNMFNQLFANTKTVKVKRKPVHKSDYSIVIWNGENTGYLVKGKELDSTFFECFPEANKTDLFTYKNL